MKSMSCQYLITRFIKNILIRLVRGKNNWCVIGTSVSDEAFLSEYIENQDEYGNDYSDIVETYVVDYMPSEIYSDISDLDKEFSWCTRYDFEERCWVSPERT